jgi:protein associated with RNAse G/E
MVNIGDDVIITAYHSDGAWYRRWHARVEMMRSNLIVTYSPYGYPMMCCERGPRTTRWNIRAYYWLDRPYNLLELYNQNGKLYEIYANVASPAKISGHEISFTDHELDVSRPAGKDAMIIDQEEFASAITTYGYSADFQHDCWNAAHRARCLVAQWVPRRKVFIPKRKQNRK